jgi:3D (Asp-Asp-Asp) domain-containing protein
MYIVSADGRYVYGYCIAADTGSYIYDVDWTVDLYMNSEAQCRSWGRRDIIIYIV